MYKSASSAQRGRLLKKLESITTLNDNERRAVSELYLIVREHAEGEDLVRDGDRPHVCCLILEGFVCRYKLLTDGKRQILSFHAPGDIPDLQSLHLGKIDHAVGALMATTAAYIEHKDMQNLTERFPGLLHAFWRETLIDAAIFREWIVGLGRRTAYARAAHLLCEMLLRFRAVDLAPNMTFKMPVSQVEFADALGLSAVHVNRTLQELRSNDLITWTRDTVTVLNWPALQEAAAFDPTYLHQHASIAEGLR